MWRYRLKKMLAEREVIIFLGVFGIAVMLADIFNNFGNTYVAAGIRICGLVLIVSILLVDLLVRRKAQPVPIPLMFTEETNRLNADGIFRSFLQTLKLTKHIKLMESLLTIHWDCLLIRLTDLPNLRQAKESNDWAKAWKQLLKNWEELDHILPGEPFTTEGYCYYIYPHVVLPLSFSLGASVGLRRKVVLYHRQPDASDFFPAVELIQPRILFDQPDSNFPEPEKRFLIEEGSQLKGKGKLILHIAVSDRHPPDLKSHSGYLQADNVALVYPFDLDPRKNWLPYIQSLVRASKELMGPYEEIELCLICPGVIAFALGMAFSRTSKITVCHWFGKEYHPVFSLENIEKQMPFD